MWRVVVVVVSIGCQTQGPDRPHWYSGTPLPAPRAGHAACDGMVMGGAGGSADVLTLHVGRDSSEWLESLPLNIGRTDASCISIPTATGNDVYVFGGAAGVPGEVRRAESHAWTVLGSPAPFETGAALVALDTRIFAFGGDGHHTNVYDMTTDTWSEVAHEPRARKFAGVTSSDNGFLIIGGRDQDDPEQPGIQQIEQYDPATDRWTVSETELPEPLVDALVSGFPFPLAVIGRIEVAPGRFLGRTEVLEGTHWVQYPPMSPLRFVWGGGELTAFGGAVQKDGVDTPTNRVDSFQPFTAL